MREHYVNPGFTTAEEEHCEVTGINTGEDINNLFYREGDRSPSSFVTVYKTTMPDYISNIMTPTQALERRKEIFGLEE